jgi:NAD(P)-dependent dehydrogenase (short-subunit alcohol dehydrogenase family)
MNLKQRNPMSALDYQQQALSFQPDAQSLSDRVIAITGAGDGIGRALALAAARCGAELVLIGRTVKRLEAVHAEITAIRAGAASIAPLNLEQAVASDYDGLAEAIAKRYGRLDGLVHNAGILGGLTAIEHFDVPTWCRVMHVNLTAAFVLTQVLLPALHRAADASIIFTSSGVGRKPRAFWGAYAVSKAGVEGLSALLAEELSEGVPIRVNVLNPGPTRTRMRRQAYPSEDVQALAEPGSIVNPYLWLLGAHARGVTGQSLNCQAPRAPAPGA